MKLKPYLVAAIKAADAEGLDTPRAIVRVGVSYQTFNKYRKALGLKFRRKVEATGQDDERSRRTDLMLGLYRDGYTLEQIGKQFGVSRERVRQCLTKYRGVRAEGGGQRVLANRRRDEARRRKDARCLAKYGCTWDEWKTLAYQGLQAPSRKYSAQRRNAHKRGIEWRFTLWTWWQVWERSGHWHERGRGQGYVMCRHGDVGPYSPENVFIAPARVNTSERRQKKSGLPIGVSRVVKGQYVAFVAQRGIGGKMYHIGSFKTPELAHAAYLSFVPPEQVAA